MTTFRICSAKRAILRTLHMYWYKEALYVKGWELITRKPYTHMGTVQRNRAYQTSTANHLKKPVWLSYKAGHRSILLLSPSFIDNILICNILIDPWKGLEVNLFEVEDSTLFSEMDDLMCMAFIPSIQRTPLKGKARDKDDTRMKSWTPAINHEGLLLLGCIVSSAVDIFALSCSLTTSHSIVLFLQEVSRRIIHRVACEGERHIPRTW